ncbi:type IV pilus assembly PilZ [Desulfovibrio sp. X2]|uniref:PilZ domain-containing protein n=1 Tax=Desulfovibrio sp. X2 TaxID=941449 RepID=UPI000358ADC1|nr:PilZ domain-containing protein [Desulfovibrio sp. X2]EPR42406.1 type IV pilus assembly PilZ [Desulfovibrio sp. X2]
MSFLDKILKVAAAGRARADKRSALRVEVPLLRAKVADKPVSISVRDISADGVSLNAVARDLKPGNEILVNLFLGSRLLLDGLAVRIVRVDKGYVGGQFSRLTPGQADFLREFVRSAGERAVNCEATGMAGTAAASIKF